MPAEPYDHAADPAAVNDFSSTDAVLAPAIEPPTTQGVDWTDPASVALWLMAVFAVIAFIFHKDLTNLAGPIAMIVVGLIGAAKAIEGALKHKANLMAVQQFNSINLDRHFATQRIGLERQQLAMNERNAAYDRPVPVHHNVTPRATKKTTARKRAATR